MQRFCFHSVACGRNAPPSCCSRSVSDSPWTTPGEAETCDANKLDTDSLLGWRIATSEADYPVRSTIPFQERAHRPCGRLHPLGHPSRLERPGCSHHRPPLRRGGWSHRQRVHHRKNGRRWRVTLRYGPADAGLLRRPGTSRCPTRHTRRRYRPRTDHRSSCWRTVHLELGLTTTGQSRPVAIAGEGGPLS